MRSRSRPEDAARVVARLSAAVPPRGGWVPPPDEGPEVPSGHEGQVPVDPDQDLSESSAEASWSARDPVAPTGTGLRQALGRAAGVLPDTVRGARVTPGRTAAAALLVVAVVAATVVALLVQWHRPREVAPPTVVRTGSPLPGTSASPSPPAAVVVSVAGRVVRPGLYSLPAGSRVDDAVRAAGGLEPGASYGVLNLARRLADGEQVLVAVEGQPGAGVGTSGGTGAGNGPLDLNAATVEQLDGLPGVGPVLAQRIVDWRAEKGRFASVDQLREVPGIGESKYATLKSKVRV